MSRCHLIRANHLVNHMSYEKWVWSKLLPFQRLCSQFLHNSDDEARRADQAIPLEYEKISDIHTYKLNSSVEGPEVRCVSSSVHKGKSCGKPTKELEELAHPPHMITRRRILPIWSKRYFSPRWKVSDRDQTGVTYRVFAYRVFAAWFTRNNHSA